MGSALRFLNSIAKYQSSLKLLLAGRGCSLANSGGIVSNEKALSMGSGPAAKISSSTVWGSWGDQAMAVRIGRRLKHSIDHRAAGWGRRKGRTRQGMLGKE